MKVTLNWLRQYVEFNWSPDELAERLANLLLECEAGPGPATACPRKA
jgi:hypothetical protein